MVENRRNNSFDLLKILFTIVIVIHHSALINMILVRGYIAVEFFFFVSGYYICSAIRKNVSFTFFIRKRLYKLYPGYLCAYVLIALAFFAVGKFSYKAPYGPLLELFMLQNVGIPKSGGLNYPLWYLSVLFYGGALVFFAKKALSNRWFQVLGGIIVVSTYCFLLIHAHGVECWEKVYGLFYIPFWRGVSDIIIGMWLYELPKPPANRHWGGGIQTISLLAIVALLFIPGELDFIAAFFLATLVYSSTPPNTALDRLGRKDLLRLFYAYQYYAYLNHALVILMISYIVKRVQIPSVVQILVILMLTALLAFCMKKIVDYLLSCINRKIKAQCFDNC